RRESCQQPFFPGVVGRPRVPLPPSHGLNVLVGCAQQKRLLSRQRNTTKRAVDPHQAGIFFFRNFVFVPPIEKGRRRRRERVPGAQVRCKPASHPSWESSENLLGKPFERCHLERAKNKRVLAFHTRPNSTKKRERTRSAAGGARRAAIT
ncbi:unnamed protein product, partial [Ectocarpus sp. 12 AP-2014]